MENTIRGGDIVEEYNKGRRDFSGLTLADGIDLGGADLRNAIFRNCKINAARFFAANLEGVDFTGTHFYFCNFNEAKLKNAVFNKCTVEWSIFYQSFIENTSMKNAVLSYIGFIEANFNELDLTGASQFRVVTDLSQVTEDDIYMMISEFGKVMGSANLERKLRNQQSLNMIMKILNKDQVLVANGTKSSNPYERESAITQGYKALTQLMDDAIKYAPKNPYKTKNAYQKDGKN